MNIKSIAIILFTSLISLNGVSQSKKLLRGQAVTLKEQSDSLSRVVASQEELLKKLSSYKEDVTSRKDSFSYAMGVELYSNNLKQQGLDTALNVDAFYIGLRNASLNLDKMSRTEKQLIIRETFTAIEARRVALQKKEEEKNKVRADSNLVWGKAFLAKNTTVDGVKTLESGLQYKVISSLEGKGAVPTKSDRVQVHYEGRLINGDVFDSSYKRNIPSTFGVTQVIKGWTEILQLMEEGDKWEVYIPSDLAYGERGSGSSIGPNETLVFTVELIKVNP